VIRYRELKRRYELDGAAKTVAHLSEALEKEQLRADDFSLRDLAEALVPCGSEWVRSLDPRSAAGVRLLENSEGVDVTAFLNVASQVVYSKIMESYRQDAFVASRLVDTIPTRLDGEKIPGIARPEDATAAIQPGMPYPNVGFGEDYIETPSTTKYGLIIPVTREAVFFDRTHLVLSRAAEVGEILGLNKEKRILDLVTGVANNYKWRGTTYNTYQATTPWSNVKTGNELVDWTDADAAEQLFAEMIDPTTSEPVLIKATHVLVMPAYRHAAHRVFSAPQITYTTGSATDTTVANPFTKYQVYESALAYRRIVASSVPASEARKWWFIGDFKRAFAYMENWPITVTQSAANSEADFNNDIVVRFKASERGAAAVMNPRYVVKSTG
jgi:hypothetical protein